MPAPVAAWAGGKVAEKVAEKVGGPPGADPSSLVRRLVPKVVGGFMVVTLLAVVAFGMTGSSSSPGCTSTGAIASSADLPPATVDGVNQLKAQYEQAGEDNGLPWALLAAIDYREDNNDPNRSALSGETLGSANPDNASVTTTTKLDSLEKAAAHVKAMASSVYGVTLGAGVNSVDDVKNAFLAYNRGSIYKDAGAPADLSPYVLNQYDDAHRDMRWPDVAGEPLAGQTEYGRYGAFTLFTRLGGLSATGCPGLSGNDIVAVAQQQLGRKEVPDGCNCGPEIAPFLGSSTGEEWCADFVSWVYMTAGHPFTGGLDGGWRLPGVTGVRNWLEQNGIYHTRGDGDVPQPGDVIIFADDEHTGIVEKVDGSSIQTIEGNTSNAVGRRTYGLDDAQVSGWGRLRATATSDTSAAALGARSTNVEVAA